MARNPVWVLVADGQRARVLERPALGEPWVERPEEALENPDPPTHAQGTDRPGRVFDSLGGHRHAIEPRQDLHEAAKAAFARRLAERLEQAAAGHRFNRLLVVAPPRFLGELREALGNRARALLAGTINKDLTHSPLPEIVAQLPDHRPA